MSCTVNKEQAVGRVYSAEKKNLSRCDPVTACGVTQPALDSVHINMTT